MLSVPAVTASDCHVLAVPTGLLCLFADLDAAAQTLSLIENLKKGSDFVSENCISDPESDEDMSLDAQKHSVLAQQPDITGKSRSARLKPETGASFVKGFTTSDDAPTCKSKSGKVLPILDQNHDGKSETSSVGTGSTLGLFHRAIERGMSGEEPSLVILRWLMMIVILFVIILSITTLSISNSVVASKVTSATLLSLGGERSIGQLVRAAGRVYVML